MKIRADLSKSAWVAPKDWEWLDSPTAGVARVMLDRDGDEVAVATSFVRYAEGSSFPSHAHALGEEFIVVEGEFGDEHGRYPAGTYVRNPAGTHHAPFSEPGCVIWVKLRQFDTADQHQFDCPLDLEMPESGRSERILHEYGKERVLEITVAAGETLQVGDPVEVVELVVLEGRVRFDGAELPRLGWLRVPAGEQVDVEVLEATRLFQKTRPVYG